MEHAQNQPLDLVLQNEQKKSYIREYHGEYELACLSTVAAFQTKTAVTDKPATIASLTELHETAKASRQRML